MSREIPGEAAMKFQVRDLMSNVFPREMADVPDLDTTFVNTLCCNCVDASCQGQSGCPQATKKPPKMALETLSVLRDQMRGRPCHRPDEPAGAELGLRTQLDLLRWCLS